MDSLSSLAMVTHLVESFSWTAVVPLPAIMELDGLASNPMPLGKAVKAAITFIAGHIYSHSDMLSSADVRKSVLIQELINNIAKAHGFSQCSLVSVSLLVRVMICTMK